MVTTDPITLKTNGRLYIDNFEQHLLTPSDAIYACVLLNGKGEKKCCPRGIMMGIISFRKF